MATLYERARNRVLDDPNLANHAEFILADWNEGEEHLRWVIDASTDEILDWIVCH